MKNQGKKRISRRGFLAGTGTALASTAVLGVAAAAPPDQPVAPRRPKNLTDISITVNGTAYPLTVEPRWTLAEVLRDHIGLTGTKIGCDAGECGACTVILEGRAVYACSQLAVWSDGKKVTTVEGLASGEKLDPLQVAFIEHDAPQCGYCTSGQLMSAKALLARNPRPSREQVQRALTGNICRCSNYNRIVEAVLAASEKAPS